MKLVVLASVILLLSCKPLFSQNNYSIKGSVLDTASGTGLQNASITVLNSKDSTLVRFTRADANGNFSLNNLREGNFILLLTYPDFADYVERFSLNPDKPSKDFGKLKMILKARLLEEVIVKGTAAQMTIKGDTTEFNAAAFNIEANSKVEDLLKQLPGIQVDQDGKITAHGQAVNKVLVDGEEFFGDDPTLVTKNIRGDMVDKVQLYDKKSDQATFTGIDDGERTKTINIKLKEDKKQGYFGKLDAGAGNDDFYQGQGMFNLFKGKKKFSAYGTIANTAKTGLGWEDNNKFGTSNIQIIEGGIMISGGGGSDLDSYDGRFNGEGIPFTRSGGVHYDNKWKDDKYSINLNYKVGSINVTGNKNSLNQNNLPNGFINTNTDQIFDNFMFRQKVDGTFLVKLDTTSDLKIMLDGTLKNSESNSNFLTSSLRGTGVSLNGSSRNLSNNGDQKTFNASALWTKKLKKKGRTLSLTLAHQFDEDDATGFLNSENSFYNNQGVIDSIRIIDQYKTNLIRSSGLNSNLAYTEPLSKTFSVILNYGLNLSNSIAERESYNKSGTGKYDLFDNEFSNDFELDQTSNQAGAIFNYRKDKNVINFGTRINAVDFKQTDRYTGNVYKRDFLNWLPQASFRHNFSQWKLFEIRYNGNTTQPTLNQIQPVKVNTDPLNIILGNPDLKPSFRSNFTLFYNSYKVLTDKSIYFRGNYSTTHNAIVHNTITDAAGKSTFQSINLTDKNPLNLTIYSGYGQKLPGTELRLGININTNANTYFNMINSVLNETRSNSYNTQLSVSRHKQKKIEFYWAIGPEYITNQSSLQKQINNNGWGANSWFEFSIYLPNKVKIQSHANYRYQEKIQSFAEDFNRLIWNTTLTKSFMKEESLKFSLTGNDLLNQNTGFNRMATSNMISQNSFTTIKRYFMFSLSYDLNHMGGGPPKK
ncbi:MAG: TonB-dependent receptor [Daejeonella sp.]|uniref:TonB-dependent receptor n=1 Tax=Daejeonella sp. TaxID=2805397 RepID=UPI0027357059|nr:TonB-dependent receptor [Daejeonella sp.]MDP3467093.1 TonB-dependent receptor [Daejeonella sp.]